MCNQCDVQVTARFTQEISIKENERIFLFLNKGETKLIKFQLSEKLPRNVSEVQFFSFSLRDAEYLMKVDTIIPKEARDSSGLTQGITIY